MVMKTKMKAKTKMAKTKAPMKKRGRPRKVKSQMSLSSQLKWLKRDYAALKAQTSNHAAMTERIDQHIARFEHALKALGGVSELLEGLPAAPSTTRVSVVNKSIARAAASKAKADMEAAGMDTAPSGEGAGEGAAEAA